MFVNVFHLKDRIILIQFYICNFLQCIYDNNNDFFLYIYILFKGQTSGNICIINV